MGSCRSSVAHVMWRSAGLLRYPFFAVATPTTAEVCESWKTARDLIQEHSVVTVRRFETAEAARGFLRRLDFRSQPIRSTRSDNAPETINRCRSKLATDRTSSPLAATPKSLTVGSTESLSAGAENAKTDREPTRAQNSTNTAEPATEKAVSPMKTESLKVGDPTSNDDGSLPTRRIDEGTSNTCDASSTSQRLKSVFAEITATTHFSIGSSLMELARATEDANRKRNILPGKKAQKEFEFLSRTLEDCLHNIVLRKCERTQLTHAEYRQLRMELRAFLHTK